MSDVPEIRGQQSGALLDDLERLTELFGEMHRLCGRLSLQLTEITGRSSESEEVGGGLSLDTIDGTAIERRALLLAGRYGRLTTVQLAEHLERAVTDVRGALGRLVDNGELVRHGRGRGTFYTVPEAEPLLGSGPLAEEAQVERVLVLARNRDRVTTADVQREIGLSQLHARKLLARMVEQGLLERHGQRRGTYFVISGRRPTDSGRLPAMSIEELLEAQDGE